MEREKQHRVGPHRGRTFALAACLGFMVWALAQLGSIARTVLP